MDIGDILKLISLTQTEINALTDQTGLYFNSPTGKLYLNGTDMETGGMDPATYDPNNKSSDAFDYENFLGTFQIPGPALTFNLDSDKDNVDWDGYNLIYLTSSSNDRRITGVKAPPSGIHRVIVVINQNSNRRIKLIGNSGSSLEANRMVLRGNAGSRNLDDFQMTMLVYNHNINKYHILRIG